MQNQPDTPRQLQDQWARAVERAAQEQARQEPGDPNLNQAAGLYIQSGIRSGLWGATDNCTNSCSCHASCAC